MYLTSKHEFNTQPLIEKVWQAEKICYLPVLVPDKDRELAFVQYKKGDELKLNRFSILEPSNVAELIKPDNLDMVVVPLLAFDKRGNRLGMGGGYYDHTFAFLKTQFNKHPQMIGLGFAIQEADVIPHDPWDVMLQGVITEKEFKNCKL